MKYSNSWHLLQSDEVLRELSTDMYKGLSTAEARRRRARNGTNGVWHVKRRSAKDIAVATLFDLATLLLVISAAAAALFDRNYEAGMIAAILVAAGIMRAVTYIRANRIFEDMAREKIPVASVVRDGVIRIVPATDIVKGDIIFLEAGDTVPCDGRVVSGEDAIVSEKGITENKTPVHKFNTVIKTEAKGGEIPCEFRSNMMFAGSEVLSGSVRIAAVACGRNALISMQQGGIEVSPAEKLPIIERLRGRSKTTSLIMLACVMALTWLSLFTDGGFTLPEVFLSTMAMAVAAMSEFITSIGYIIVAVTLRDAADGKTDGVVERSAAREETENGGEKAKTASRIIVREPEKLETITTPDIVVFCGSQYFKSGRIELSAYRANGVLFSGDKLRDSEKTRIAPLAELLRLSSAASAGTSGGMVSAGGRAKESDTAATVKRAVESYVRMSGDTLTQDWAILDHCGSDEVRSGGLDCSLIVQNERAKLVVCGAVDAVMRCCTDVITQNGRETVTKEHKRDIFTECAGLEFGGARVIAVASKRTSASHLEPASMTNGMTFVGFYALSQETEKETNSNIRTNVEFMKKSGIIPVLLTENPDEDLYYCHRFGMFNKKTVKVSSSEIGSVSIDELTTDGMIVSFADIGGVYLTSAYENAVKSLRGTTADGGRERVIAAVGMNVWDSGALAAADFGAAVSGAEFRSVPETLSKNSSLVIYPEAGHTDPGFGGLTGFVRAVRYMRRAVENIDSAKIYITASQSARLALILASVFTPVPMLNAVFILIWGLLFDFATALVMAFENNGRDDGYVRKRFIRRDEDSEASALGDGHVTFISILIGVAWGTAVALVIPLLGLLAPVLGFTYTAQIGSASMAAAVIVSGMILALETMHRGSIFRQGSPNVAQMLYVLVSAVIAALFVFTRFGARLASGEACAEGAFIALIPALFILIASEIAKLIKHHREKKDGK